MRAPASPSVPAPAAAPPTPERVADVLWSYAETQALSTAVELDLFSHVAAGHRTADALARAAGASARGTRMLADAMAGLGLLEKSGDAYALAPDAAAFLVRSSPAYLGDFVVFHTKELVARWTRLTESVRTGEPVLAVDVPEQGIPFWRKLVDALFPLGFAGARQVGEELARRHPGRAVRLLDVAAGSGVWGIGAALANPAVSVVAQDLEATLELTRAWVDRMGVAGRVSYLAGDLRTVDFGAGAFDAAVLGHICHSEGPVHTPRLLAKVARALRPGGTVVIVEFVPDEGRASPKIPLLFALNMLVLTTEGDTYPFSQYRAWLEAAGFRDVVSMPAAAPSPLILATKA